MSDFIPPHAFNDDELEARLELFRYTDLTHPLMQMLFVLQPPSPSVPEEE